MFDSLIDTVLDRTVVAGYMNVGYRIRRGMWTPGDLQPLGGKVVLVTGATSGPRLDVLVNNAGALPSERTLSVDGIELTFATNLLGAFLLTNLLTPLLKKSAPARIINVSSGGMYTQRIHVEDLHRWPTRGSTAPPPTPAASAPK